MAVPPRSALRPLLALVAALLAALGGAPGPRAALAQGAEPDRRPTLAVLYFTNAAMVQRETYAPLAKGLAEMLITELAGNPGVRVVERDRVQALFEEQDLAAGGRMDPATAARAGKVLGARYMLFGTFVVDPRETMRLDVRAINTETSAQEYATSITGKADRMLELVGALGTKVNEGLRLPPVPAATPAPPGIGGKGPNQLRSMLLLSRALEAQDRKDVSGAARLMQEAVTANPDNARARTLLTALQARQP